MAAFGEFLKDMPKMTALESNTPFPETSNADIIAMLQAGYPHFTKLTIKQKDGVQDLIEILEACPWMEFVSIQRVNFCRKTGLLDFCHDDDAIITHLDAVRLIALTSQLTRIRDHTFNRNDSHIELLLKLVKANATTLQSIQIWRQVDLTCLTTALIACTNLTELIVEGCALNCTILTIVTKTCKRIQTLTLTAGFMWFDDDGQPVGDEEMIELFTNCFHLKQLSLDNLVITYGTLQAIVMYQVPLHSFTWKQADESKNRGLSDEDLLRFVELAKEHKLLSVPRILKAVDYS